MYIYFNFMGNQLSPQLNSLYACIDWFPSETEMRGTEIQLWIGLQCTSSDIGSLIAILEHRDPFYFSSFFVRLLMKDFDHQRSLDGWELFFLRWRCGWLNYMLLCAVEWLTQKTVWYLADVSV